MQRVIANDDIPRASNLVMWSLNDSDITYVEKSPSSVYISSGTACRDFKKGEQLSEVDIVLCQLNIKLASDTPPEDIP